MLLQKASVCSNFEECSSVSLPNHVPFEHPSTKWLLNTFRNGANNRLGTMMKEKPSMFRRLFQIYDSPAEILADPSDTQPMFNRSTALYLRPLSLAVYMRCKSAVQLLLSSSLCDPMEYGYASDVYVQLAHNSGGDLLEFLPVCIAIRRQFLDILPLLFRLSPNPPLAAYSPRTPFSLRYLNRRSNRVTTYTDVFQYATELAQCNRRVNIVKILEVLIDHCTGFYSPGRLDEVKKSDLYSLFRRLIYLGLYVDTECRIASPLIQCMNFLIRRAHFKPCTIHPTSNLSPLNFNDLPTTWKDLNEWTRDCYTSVALLFLLYLTFIQRGKFSVAVHAMNLLFRALFETNLLDSALGMPVERLTTVLDFILKQDQVAEEFMSTGKHGCYVFQMSRGSCGDDKSSTILDQIKWKQLRPEILSQMVEKLRAIERLNVLRQTHLMNISRAGRVAFNHICLPRSHLSVSQAAASAEDHDGKPFPTGQPISEQPGESFRSIFGRTQPGQATSESQSISSDDQGTSRVMHVESNASAMPPLTTNDYNPGRVSPITLDSYDDVKLTEMESYDSFKHLHHSLLNLRELDAPDLDDSFTAEEPVPAGDDPRHNRGSGLLRRLQSNLKDQTLFQPLYCEKSCQVKEAAKCRRAVSALTVRRSSVEHLSLRDFDHILDCITSSALACERGLDGQLLEEIFKEYIDQSVVPSRAESRANSVIGTQVYREYDEEITTLNLESWTFTADTSGLTLDGDQAVKSGDKRLNVARSAPDLFKEDSRLTPTNACPPVLQSNHEKDKNRRKFRWSCAKPMCHLNHAFGALKQQITASRRSDSRARQKNSPTTDTRSCV